MTNKKASLWFKHLSVLLELEKKSFVILLVMFTFLGFMAVLGQVFLPEMMELAGLLIIGLPEPSMIGILSDFWGDLSFIGAIVALFYGVNAFSADLDVDKKIFFILNHPISRTQHFLGKSLVKILSIFTIILISSVITYLMGLYFYSGYEIKSFLLATSILGLTLASILSIVLMLNSRLSTSGTVISMGVYFIIILTLNFLIPIFDFLKWFSPFKLSNIWAEILLINEYSDVLPNFLALFLTIIISLAIGNYLYNKRDL